MGQYLRGFSRRPRSRCAQSWELGRRNLPPSGPEIAPVSLSFSESWEPAPPSFQLFGPCRETGYDNAFSDGSIPTRSTKRIWSESRCAGSRIRRGDWRAGGDQRGGSSSAARCWLRARRFSRSCSSVRVGPQPQAAKTASSSFWCARLLCHCQFLFQRVRKFNRVLYVRDMPCRTPRRFSTQDYPGAATWGAGVGWSCSIAFRKSEISPALIVHTLAP